MASEVGNDSEILWLAFRYVAGDLTADEADSFEDRLDQDQEAREAVARAVELTGAIAALQPDSNPSQRPSPTFALPRRRSLWTIMGVASLAAAACLSWLAIAPLRPGPESEVSASRPVPSPTVTLAWSTLRQEGEGEKDESTALVALNDDLPTLTDAEDNADTGLPLWLLDAASLAEHPNQAAAPAKEL